MSNTLNQLCIATLVLTMLVAHPMAADEKKEDGKSPAFAVDAKVEGKTYAEWSAEWWQWALAIEKKRNPLLDKTGEFAVASQPKGRAWFLAGTTGGSATRKVTIPSGRVLIFPVVNYSDWGEEGKPITAAKEKESRAEAKALLAKAEKMEVTIDGKKIPNIEKFRVASGVFAFEAPASQDDCVFPDMKGKREGVSDGFWVALKPLSPGKHTIRFKAKINAEKKEDRMELDVTYNLTIAEPAK